MQISSYFSMLMSIGSIIIGLLLAKENRNWDRATVAEAAESLLKRKHQTLSLE